MSLTLFFITLFSYYAYVFFFSVAAVLGLFAPFILLKFLQENLLPGLYFILGFIFFSGVIFFPPQFAGYYILTVAIPTVIIYLSRNDWRVQIPRKYALILAPAAMFVGTAAGILIFKEQAAALQTEIAGVIEKALSPLFASDSARLDPDSRLANLYHQKDTAAKYVMGLMPALMYVYIYSITLFTERFYYKTPSDAVQDLPDFLVWVVAFSGVCVVVPLPQLTIIGLNGLLVTAVIYFFRGFDVIKFNLIKWNIPPILRFFMLLTLFLEITLMATVAALGLTSVYIDLTKPKKETGA